MLQFAPEHQLLFSPSTSPSMQLQSTLTISNPSPRPAVLKIKASHPSLFIVTPPAALILSQQTLRVTLMTRAPSTPQLIHDISYQNKFLVEYALLTSVPSSVQEGIRQINEDNKQLHRLFVATDPGKDLSSREDRSAISNNYTYRTVNNDHEDHFPSFSKFSRQNYQDMTQEQKNEHLSRQVDRLEKEKSELILYAQPKRNLNIIKLVIALIIGLLVGYFSGKAIFVSSPKTKKQKQYKYFGLEKYWVSDDQEQSNHKWYQFWK